VCNQQTGLCDNGCSPGWYSPTCAKPCPSPNCKNNQCDVKDGTCSGGCVPGRWKTYCNSTCYTRCVLCRSQSDCDGYTSCEQTTGNCTLELCRPFKSGNQCVNTVNSNAQPCWSGSQNTCTCGWCIDFSQCWWKPDFRSDKASRCGAWCLTPDEDG
jgi:hypothetical protein